MEALQDALLRATTNDAAGRAIAGAAGQQLGLSVFSMLRVSRPVLSPGDFFVLGACAPSQVVREAMMEMVTLIDRELAPFGSYFAGSGKSFDLALRHPAEVLRRTVVYNEVFRPFRVERQLIGFLGSLQEPLGFICAARSERDWAFTSTDLAAFEAIRSAVEQSFRLERRVGVEGLEDTLLVLSAATPEPWLLFDGRGQVVWLNDAACGRLELGAARFGPCVAVGRSEALEGLRTWVRAEARKDGDSALSCAPPACAPLPSGEQLVMRRYEITQGKPLFLIGFLAPSSGPPAADGARTDEIALRVSRFAREYGLTRRQGEVLAQLAQGSSNKAIAAALGCADNTVELHVTRLLAKLGCRSRTEIVARFWRA